MLFSILIPVYNTSEYLAECIDSVLRQTESDYEIVLLNDGSTDDSGEICNRYAEKHSQIRVIHKENEGLMMTRRRGFREAKGDYFICLDSDDYLCDDHALSKIKHLIVTDHCDMVLYNYIYGASQEKPEREIILFDHPDGYVFEGDSKRELFQKLLVGASLNPMWIKANRRDVVDIDVDYSVWQKDICRGEDNFQSFPLLTNAQRIGYLNAPLYYYRQTPGAISYNPKLKFYYAYRCIYRRENEYLDRWNVSDELRRGALKKRVSQIVGIITTGYERAKTRQQKKEWYHFLQELGRDPFFEEIYKISVETHALRYYQLICFLIVHRFSHLTAGIILATDRISAFRHRKEK